MEEGSVVVAPGSMERGSLTPLLKESEASELDLSSPIFRTTEDRINPSLELVSSEVFVLQGVESISLIWVDCEDADKS